MKKYEAPYIELTLFDDEDIVTSSSATISSEVKDALQGEGYTVDGQTYQTQNVAAFIF